ncbi:MAG: hypothetical protein P0119_22805, partial [Nitrospira sp.]|nr:hypothetical protein [Nitrospira sp.]
RRLVRSAIAEWIEDRAEALKAHRLEFWYADLEAAQAVRFRIGRAGGKYRFGTVIHMERVRDLSDEALVFKVRQECEHALQQSIRR